MRNLLLILIFSLLFPAIFFSDEILAKSSIDSVIVYPDRAEVFRKANLKVKPGSHTIVFDKLPASLIPNSVRVSGEETSSVKFLGVELEDHFYESPLLPEIVKIENRIEELESKVAKMKEEIDILNSQENFIKSIQSKTAEKASQEIILAKPDFISWEKAMGFFESKLKTIKTSKLELLKKIDENKKEIDALKKKLESMAPSKPLEGKRVIVSIETSKEEVLNLNLSYITKNSGWSPLYNLKALIEKEEIEFSLYSKVSQKSGEDWSNAKVFLSTSSPALQVEPPPLTPWILDIYIPRPIPRKEFPMEALGEEKKALMEFAEAEIIETGLHWSFGIPEKISIPSDGSPHKFIIDFNKLPAKFDYITVPKLSENAFLRGKTRNTLPYPIISGSADLFIYNEFIGSRVLPFTAKDDEISLFFGRDNQIKVKHEIIKKERGKAGLLGGKERIKFAYRITIQNLRKNQIEIEVIDQVPISQNTQIEVKDVNLNPEPSKKDEKGILSWILSIPSQARKEITIEFTVEFPKNAEIRGL